MFLIGLFQQFEMPALIVAIFAYILALILALSTREFVKAFVANREGDVTAQAMGRLTLNPFKHLDWLGLIFLLFLGFGWSKPVPINVNALKNGKKSVVKIVSASMVSNLILAIIFSFFYALTFLLDTSVTFFFFLQILCSFSMSINFVFFVFHLLPIYPLDGFLLLSLFVSPANKFLNFMYRYGFWILLVLLITNIFDYILLALELLILNPLLNLWALILF